MKGRKELQQRKMEFIAQRLESNKGNKRRFKAMKHLERVQNQNNKLISPSALLPVVTTYYTYFCNQGRLHGIEPWIGEPRPLDPAITVDEVRDAAGRLSNGKVER
jgi:hypothetical protein